MTISLNVHIAYNYDKTSLPEVSLPCSQVRHPIVPHPRRRVSLYCCGPVWISTAPAAARPFPSSIDRAPALHPVLPFPGCLFQDRCYPPSAPSCSFRQPRIRRRWWGIRRANSACTGVESHPGYPDHPQATCDSWACMHVERRARVWTEGVCLALRSCSFVPDLR